MSSAWSSNLSSSSSSASSSKNQQVLTLSLPIDSDEFDIQQKLNESPKPTILTSTPSTSGITRNPKRVEVFNRLFNEDLGLKYEPMPTDYIEEGNFDEFLTQESEYYNGYSLIDRPPVEIQQADYSFDGSEYDFDDDELSKKLSQTNSKQTISIKLSCIAEGAQPGTSGGSKPNSVFEPQAGNSSHLQPPEQINSIDEKPIKWCKRPSQAKLRQQSLDREFQRQKKISSCLKSKIGMMEAKCKRLREILNSMVESSPDFVLEATRILKTTENEMKNIDNGAS